MQEDIENRTVSLAISTGRLSARAIEVGVRAYLEHHNRRKMTKASDIPHGKQTVKQLIGQNQGVSTIEINDKNIKVFQKLAKKYGVDFAIQKDKSSVTSNYLVFFKARDADALDAVLKDYTAYTLKQKGKHSVLERLEQFKEKVSKIPKKIRNRKKEKTR